MFRVRVIMCVVLGSEENRDKGRVLKDMYAICTIACFTREGSRVLIALRTRRVAHISLGV